MQADLHVWKTADGRLVLAGDPDATTLAYAPGDDVPAKDQDAVSALCSADRETTAGSKGQDGEDQQGSQPALSDQPTKQTAKPADKAAKRDADK